MNNPADRTRRLRVPSVLALVVCLFGQWFSESQRAFADSTEDIKPRLADAVKAYQQAMDLSDRESRMAAFRNVEIALASFLDVASPSKGEFDADVYVIWGNSALQINETGKAVYAYRQALLIDPVNERATQNLEYVRAQLPEWARSSDEPQGTLANLFFWNHWFSKTSIEWYSAVAFMIGCVIFAASVFWRSLPLRYVSIVPLLVWLILLVSLSLRLVPENQIVFIADDTQIYSADSENSPPGFGNLIPAGTEAILREKRDPWVEIELHNGKTGWVPLTRIKLIQ